MNDIKSLGQVAFEAYCEAVGGTTYDGKPIPGWDELSGDTATVQGGWEAAARAVREHVQAIDALDAASYTPRRIPGRGRPVREFLPSSWDQVTPEGQPLAGGRGEPTSSRPVPIETGPDVEG